MKYSRVSAEDDEMSATGTGPCPETGDDGKAALGHNLRSESVPISKPPSQRRDPIYFLIFLFAFLFLGMLSSIIKREPLEGSLIPAASAGSWASMIMIAPLLATFAGVGLFLILSFHRTLRELLFKYAFVLSLLSQICLLNIVLLGSSTGWSFWLVVFLLVSIVWDGLRAQDTPDSLASDLSMIELIESINEPFDTLLLFTGLALATANMFLLLWWGVTAIYILSELSALHGLLLSPLLLLLLYWLSSFLRYYLSSLIGGSMFWTFHRPQEALYDLSAHQSQLLLYFQSSSGPCIGSLCKAALFCPFFHSLLYVMAVLELKVSSESTSFYPLRCLLHSLSPPLLALYRSSGLENVSRHFHRLAPLYISTFGQTHQAASHLLQRRHPNLIDMISIDTLAYRLQLLSNWCSICLSLLLVAMASIESPEMKQIWLTFFLFCYLLCSSSLSLCLYGLVAACDAMYLGAYDFPDIFLERSPILFHRMQRINEIELSP
jgi:hypothetical protein